MRYIKTFNEKLLIESMDYIENDGYIKLDVDEKYFKDNGYIYQKLFASNIPFYHKKYNDHHIWCNMKMKDLFVDDWHDFLTPTILNYYIQNRNTDKVKTSTTFPDFRYISCRINRETGEIKSRDEILAEIGVVGEKLPSLEFLDKYNNSVYLNEWSPLVLSIRQMDPLIEEINRLTNNKFIIK